MLNNPDYRDLLRCRSQTTSENDNGFSDNFDAQLYKDLQLQGLFHGDYDIALGLFIDGFDVGGNKFTIVHGIVFNFPPTVRYQWHNVFQCAIIPGEPKSKALWSFLDPILNDNKCTSDRGVRINCLGFETVFKVHLLLFSGDIPAVSAVSGHAGHMSGNGCRICLQASFVGDDVSGRYYMAPPDQVVYRRREDFIHGDEFHGLTGVQSMAMMQMFLGPEFFGLDEMHLLGQGLAQFMYRFFNGDFIRRLTDDDDDSGQDNCELMISFELFQQVLDDMHSSISTIPTTFDGSVKKPSTRWTTRAVDYLD